MKKIGYLERHEADLVNRGWPMLSLESVRGFLAWQASSGFGGTAGRLKVFRETGEVKSSRAETGFRWSGDAGTEARSTMEMQRRNLEKPPSLLLPPDPELLPAAASGETMLWILFEESSAGELPSSLDMSFSVVALSMLSTILFFISELKKGLSNSSSVIASDADDVVIGREQGRFATLPSSAPPPSSSLLSR